MGKHGKNKDKPGGWSGKSPQQKADEFDASHDASQKRAAGRPWDRPAPIQGTDNTGGDIGIPASGPSE